MTISAESIKQAFEAQGISIANWARARSFDPRLVYSILNRKAPTRRGKSHQIAIALGLKADTELGDIGLKLGLHQLKAIPSPSEDQITQGKIT